MWLLTIAAVLAVCKVLAFLGMLEVAWLVALSWWWVIGAFVLTAAWFAYADHSGLSSRKAMEQLTRRKQDRLEAQRDLLRNRTRRKR